MDGFVGFTSRSSGIRLRISETFSFVNGWLQRKRSLSFTCLRLISNALLVSENLLMEKMEETF